jgi:uncharacterized sulfatase
MTRSKAASAGRHLRGTLFLAAVSLLAAACGGDSAGAPDAGPSASEPVAGDQPNIVLFLSDDHSRDDTGCYGSEHYQTPNIDRLAQQGLVFENAATVSAICVPSRASLLTGLYPHRHGAMRNHSEVHAGTRSLPHHLAELGYRVILAGKQHVAPDADFPFEFLQSRKKTTKLIEQALDADREAPFCLVVSSHEPHDPHPATEPSEPGYVDPDDVFVPPHLIDTRPMREELALYAADVWRMDKQVGLVLDMLERRGLSASTLVAYTSDHGHGLMAKFSCYDVGLGVPLVVRWPGVVEPGRRTDALVSLVDWLPTLVEVAGGEAPADVDGRSLLPLLRGETDSHREVLFATHTNLGVSGGNRYPIRSAWDHEARYIRNLRPAETFTNWQMMDTSGRELTDPSTLWGSWRQAAAADPEVHRRLERFLVRPAEELYDRRSDPHELTNVATDAAHEERLVALRRKLDQWLETWPADLR